ncbi:MAG: VCBS repeat-containing protein, partial [Gemmatimonadetes bacterium]|nr:VCBS repeat-containing protein [Gemmatimonadota bacterium]
QPGGSYGKLSGTSMAAPHVAAAAALVRARHPEYSRLQVLGALVAASADVGRSGWDESTGHGSLQLPEPSASAPLAIAFQLPASDRQVRGADVNVVAGYEAAAATDYVIDWGRGPSPQQWNMLQSGAIGPGAGRLSTLWPTAALAAGSYTLRIRVGDIAGGNHEDRVFVHRVSADAEVSDVRLVRVLQGPRWRDMVEWTTTRAAPGMVEVMAAGDIVLRVSVPRAETEHVLALPEDLPPGDYQVRVSSGIGTPAVMESLRVQPTGVQRWDLARLSEIRADGYLLPGVTDYDADGLGELVAMVFGGGAYGATSFFEEQEPLPVFTTTRLFIPWETGDFDLDGVTDLLAVDARRVRIFEPSTIGTYPDHVAWEMRGVWGGEVADLDGDARPELILRSATGQLFRVLESDGDNSFSETAVMVNDTPGENEMGDRQSVGDLDGDGRGEWVSGDSDGDLILFESAGDNAYRHTWSDIVNVADVDGRLLSAVADLDGDGANEFISGRLTQDPFDVEGRRWMLSVYGATGDNEYGIEWQTQIVAGAASGSGISIADLDGDGLLEWIVALVPQLYVFQSDGAGGYDPVWHTSVRRTQRPAVGDLDGDGRQELTYNRAQGGLETVRWQVPDTRLFSPTGWAAAAAGPDRVRLTWEIVPGAASYRVRRDQRDLVRIVDSGAQSISFTDSGLVAGVPHVYDIAAVDSAGRTGHHTQALTAMPASLPKVITAQRSSRQQLTINFDQPMGAATVEPFRYSLLPDVATAEAVILDRSGRRAVIAFSAALPDSGVVNLRFAGLHSVQGAPLGTQAVDVMLSQLVAATRLREATATSAVTIRAFFDRPVDVAQAVVIVDGGAVDVETVRNTAQDAVLIQLSATTPLRPLGRRYEVAMSGFVDDLGRSVSARVFVTLQATELDELLVFPNPLDPAEQRLSVAGLPVGTQ